MSIFGEAGKQDALPHIFYKTYGMQRIPHRYEGYNGCELPMRLFFRWGRKMIIRGKTIRERLEEKERKYLSPMAKLSSESMGRLRPEEPCPLRPAFQHDRDRILHSKAFRRLKHKTQVFLSPTGDHYRTRLTHTLEVAQISRTIAKSLFLNEDLTEAIALGHDIGHTPFGHAGEAVLNEIMPGGFRHMEQSLRVVDFLENEGKGLNLTHEVRDGILKHSKGMGEILPEAQEAIPKTLEGQVVRVADIVAYISHDLDDALRAGILEKEELPKECLKTLGYTHSGRINTMVVDIVESTEKMGLTKINISKEVAEAMIELRDFLYERVYHCPEVYSSFIKASKIIKDFFNYFLENPNSLPSSQDLSVERRICDFIAGMSDKYALNLYESLFLPRPWIKV